MPAGTNHHGKGETSSALFRKLKGVALFVGENAHITGIYGESSH